MNRKPSLLLESEERGEVLSRLLGAQTPAHVETIIEHVGGSIDWVPVGENPGNYGVIGMSTDPYAGITERITNAIDAVIELGVELSPELKLAPTPRKAAEKVFGFKDGNLRWCEDVDLAQLSSRIKVRFQDGDEPRRPTIEFVDRGIGRHPLEFKDTMVGLNRTYKASKLYLMGAFGQGGQTSLAHCPYAVILSRKHPSLLGPDQMDLVGWTIIRYHDPTTRETIYKHGRWEYCVEKESKEIAACKPSDLRVALDHGTIVRLVSYELPRGTSDVLQPASTAWSFLSQSLFDPILPLRLHEKRSEFENRNRPLSGLARRLWGGGKGEKTKIWRSDSYLIDLRAKGRVRVNYWALTPTDETENWRDIRKGYTTPGKAVFVTINGQTHGTEPTGFLKDQVGLVYASEYLIVQIDCDELSNQAKKDLLGSGRDRLKETYFKDELLDEVANCLKQDRNVLVFERERRAKILSTKSDRDVSKIRKLVGRYIAQNPELSSLILSRAQEKTPAPREMHEEATSEPDEIREEELDSIELKDIPTFLRITNARDPIPVEKGGNALIRLESDAKDGYCEETWDVSFRCVQEGGLVSKRSSSRLRNGKISYYLHCPQNIRVGTRDKLTFALDLPDGTSLMAKRDVICVHPHERRREKSESKLPEPRIRTITKAEDTATWGQFGWNDSSVGRVFMGNEEEDSAICVSLDNLHLRKSLARFSESDMIKNVEDRYVSAVAYYLLLRHVQKKKARKTNPEDENQNDDSPELDRLAQTVLMLALPIENL